MRRMGHNKMFAAYSEYTIGSRPEAALIQHNSRCGGGVAVAVAVSGSVEPPLPADNEASPGQKPSPPNYEGSASIPHYLSSLSEVWNGAGGRQIVPNKA